MEKADDGGMLTSLTDLRDPLRASRSFGRGLNGSAGDAFENGFSRNNGSFPSCVE